MIQAREFVDERRAILEQLSPEESSSKSDEDLLHLTDQEFAKIIEKHIPSTHDSSFDALESKLENLVIEEISRSVKQEHLSSLTNPEKLQSKNRSSFDQQIRTCLTRAAIFQKMRDEFSPITVGFYSPEYTPHPAYSIRIEPFQLPSTLLEHLKSKPKVEVGFSIQEFSLIPSSQNGGALNLLTHYWIHAELYKQHRGFDFVSRASFPMMYLPTLESQKGLVLPLDLEQKFKPLDVHTHNWHFSPNNAKISLQGNQRFYSFWSMVEKPASGTVRATLHWVFFNQNEMLGILKNPDDLGSFLSEPRLSCIPTEAITELYSMLS
jgi:hypothetical protein